MNKPIDKSMTARIKKREERLLKSKHNVDDDDDDDDNDDNDDDDDDDIDRKPKPKKCMFINILHKQIDTKYKIYIK